MLRRLSLRLFGLLAHAGLSACRDLSGFSSNGDHFEGPVAAGDFVRAGIDSSTRMCLTLDTDHLQDGPGPISTSDGRFALTPLRPIPQIWHDPLSTLSFGEGRLKNLVYVATPNNVEAGVETDVFAVVSLMQSNAIEVRILRGAPSANVPDAAAPAPSPVTMSAPNLFAIFTLSRAPGSCSF